MKGSHIKKILLEKGISQGEVARRIGESQQNFSAALKSDDVKTGLVERIAGATDIPIGNFYGDAYVATTNGDNAPVVAGHDNQVNTCAVEFLKEIAAQRQMTDKVLDQNSTLLRIIEKQTK